MACLTVTCPFLYHPRAWGGRYMKLYAHHDKIRNLPNLQAAYRDQIPLNGNLQSGNLKEPKD
jgi:hypothetical protein